MQVEFKDKVVVVTGGSRGLGAAMARSLVSAGARVVLHYGLSQAQALTLVGELGASRCVAVQADLSAAGAASHLWHQGIKAFCRIDVPVSNAAVVTPLTVDDDDARWSQVWAETLQVNVRAVGDLCREAIKHFRCNGGGIIVNIASRAAFRGDDPHLMHYAASKGALVALTRSIARSYASEKVLAYVIAPGFVRTERQENVIQKRGEAAMIGDIPLGEMATPQDIANVVTFVASGLARHATGATIDINGASYFH